MSKVWREVIRLGRLQEKKECNELDQDDITTILATIDFFGASNIWMKQTYFDLSKKAKPISPRFKVFDWLAMCIDGRNDDDRKQNEAGLKVLVYSFLKVKGNVKKFIEDLRLTDYQVNTKWEEVDLYR